MPLTQIKTSNLDSNNSLFFRNRIINGAMTIDQRNAGGSVAATDSSYSVDRFPLRTNQSGKYTAQQNAGSVTPPPGFTNYLGITSISAYSPGANDYIGVQHKIEGYNVADFDLGKSTAVTWTLSFWVRSSLTGTFGGSYRNSAQDRSYVFTYTINSANTWEYKTITTVGDTSGAWLTTNGMGLDLWFNLGSGSNLSASPGSWTSAGNLSATGSVNVVSTNGATWYITGVQLEKGTTATPFERRPHTMELQSCQRYYQCHKYYGVVGQGQNTDRNSGSYVSFPVAMRTTPTSAARTMDQDIGDLNIAYTPLLYADPAGNGIGWRLYRNSATSTTRGDTIELLGTDPFPFSAEL